VVVNVLNGVFDREDVRGPSHVDLVNDRGQCRGLSGIPVGPVTRTKPRGLLGDPVGGSGQT